MSLETLCRFFCPSLAHFHCLSLSCGMLSPNHCLYAHCAQTTSIFSATPHLKDTQYPQIPTICFSTPHRTFVLHCDSSHVPHQHLFSPFQTLLVLHHYQPSLTTINHYSLHACTVDLFVSLFSPSHFLYCAYIYHSDLVHELYIS
jgi:hypothetical protein